MIVRKTLAAIFTAASLADAASADQLTATVAAYDPAGIITLDDKSQVVVDPARINGKIVPGVLIVLEWTGTENGYDPIHFVRVMGPGGTRSKLN